MFVFLVLFNSFLLEGALLYTCPSLSYDANFKTAVSPLVADKDASADDDKKNTVIEWKTYKTQALDDLKTLNDMFLCAVNKIKTCAKASKRDKTCFLDALVFSVELDAYNEDLKVFFPTDNKELEAKYKVDKAETDLPKDLVSKLDKLIKKTQILVLAIPAYLDSLEQEQRIELVYMLMDEDFSSVVNNDSGKAILDKIEQIASDDTIKDKDLAFYKTLMGIDAKNQDELRQNEDFKKLIKAIENLTVDKAIDTSIKTPDTTNNNNTDVDTDKNNDLADRKFPSSSDSKKSDKKDKDEEDAKTTPAPVYSAPSPSGGGTMGGFRGGRYSGRKNWEEERKKRERENKMRTIRYKGKRLAKLRNVSAPSKSSSRRGYGTPRYGRPRYSSRSNKPSTNSRKTLKSSKSRRPLKSIGLKNKKSSYNYNKGDKPVKGYSGSVFTLLDKKAALASLKRNNEYLARDVNLFDVILLIHDYYYRGLGSLSDKTLKYK